MGRAQPETKAKQKSDAGGKKRRVMATASHSVACICVVGALNQCLYLRRLNAKADGAVEDANEAGGSETAPDGPGADDDGSCLEEEEEEEDFKFHLLAHCALDVIEERVGTLGAADGVGTNASGSKSSFLGLLFPTEEYRVYGYAFGFAPCVVDIDARGCCPGEGRCVRSLSLSPGL